MYVLYASFGTFCVQIVQLFEAQWVWTFVRNRNLRHSPSKTTICRCSSIFQRLTAAVTRIIDQFGRKWCKKKCKDLSYQLLREFFHKYFIVRELWACKNSFSTYVCYTLDVLFWWAVYVRHEVKIQILPCGRHILEKSCIQCSSAPLKISK